ncbi:MAG: glutamate--cysteine ligase [Candidatus Omnitrophica bacterium]|nr:glutamate--cysteine ligase [Candidatus Omnitrophota bacterium]
MINTKYRTPYSTIHEIIDRISKNNDDINTWLFSFENTMELPLYSSVDIRDAGFKAAVVDTNLFPAGFNNLCEHGLSDSVEFIRSAILKRVQSCRNILIVAEEHTRNTWYLENLRILKSIIEQAGFSVKVATFLQVQPAFCRNACYVRLTTATGHPLDIYCFKTILSAYRNGEEQYDLIILNNDLTTGIPDVLKESTIPIYPATQAGWHSRLKSYHFNHTEDLIKQFADILDVDPWFFSCLFTSVDQININDAADRQRLKDAADAVMARVQIKYRQHSIQEKPYLFLKADSGTYGMAVLPMEDPKEILTLNRKDRNKLYKGKGSQVVGRYLIQEGVPTIYQADNEVSEVCIYQIENSLIGGFYRTHPVKNQRQNLNSQGMYFKKMCPHVSRFNDCGVSHDINVFDLYRILARIAAIAAHREIVQLKAGYTNSIK